MVRVYIAAATGASNLGYQIRELSRRLLKEDGIELTLHTNRWLWNRRKEDIGGNFTDTKFREYIFRNGYVNRSYLVEDEGDVLEGDFFIEPASNTEVEPEKCMIRQFEGKEDVWIAVGNPEMAEKAPEDEDIHTILLTGFDCDLDSQDTDLDKVDEIWVPSELAKKAFSESFPDLKARIQIMKPSMSMQYEPTKYDCRVCPDKHREFSSKHVRDIRCLKDGRFNFLVVSRRSPPVNIYRVLRAFMEEFSSDDAVRLFLNISPDHRLPYEPSRFVKGVLKEIEADDIPPVGIAEQNLRDQYLYDLIGFCDGFIETREAGSAGNAHLQAAYCRTPVISSEQGYGQGSGFLTVEDGSIEDLRKKMRELFEMNERERKSKGEYARQYVKENFGGKNIDSRLQRIREVSK